MAGFGKQDAKKGFEVFRDEEEDGKLRDRLREPSVQDDEQNEGNPPVDALELPKSKMQLRRERKIAAGLKVGTNERQMGIVRGQGDNLEALLKDVWENAAYHEDRRDSLIEKANAHGGRYKFNPEYGGHPNDITAFHPPDENLRFDLRSERPDIIFRWKAEEADIEKAKSFPGYLYDEGRILLDRNNRPIVNWPELPLTVSSRVEGLRMEYWRRINRYISLDDIVARAPTKSCKRAGLTIKDLSRATYGNRMLRDRVLSFCVAWHSREGSDRIEERMLDCAKDVADLIKSTNSSRHRLTDMTAEEFKYVKGANKGIGTSLLRPGPARRKALASRTQSEINVQQQKLTKKASQTDSSGEESDEEIPDKQSASGSVDENTLPTLGLTLEKAREPSPKITTEQSAKANNESQTNSKKSRHSKAIRRSQLPITRDSDSDSALEAFLAGAEYDPRPKRARVHQQYDTDEDSDDQPSRPAKTTVSIQPNTQNQWHLSDEELDPESPSLSIEEEDPENSDFSMRDPRTHLERLSIRAALIKTVRHFKSILGRYPAPTDAQKSYCWQFVQMKQELDDAFQVGRTAPTLHFRLPWKDSFDGWMAAEDAEVAAEAVRVANQTGDLDDTGDTETKRISEGSIKQPDGDLDRNGKSAVFTLGNTETQGGMQASQNLKFLAHSTLSVNKDKNGDSHSGAKEHSGQSGKARLDTTEQASVIFGKNGNKDIVDGNTILSTPAPGVMKNQFARVGTLSRQPCTKNAASEYDEVARYLVGGSGKAAVQYGPSPPIYTKGILTDEDWAMYLRNSKGLKTKSAILR